MAGKFNLKKFFADDGNLAAIAPAADVFGLLTRSLDLPHGWAALVTRTTRDHVVAPPGAVVEAGDADDLLFVRVSPVEVALRVEDALTSDRYRCRADVRLSVAPVPEVGELRSFSEKILGSRRTVRTESLLTALASAVRDSVLRSTAEHEAAELVEGSAGERVADALVAALDGACFAAGLTLQGKPTVLVSSDTLRQIRDTQQRAVRSQAEHVAARGVQRALERAQGDHLDHLASMLERLKAMSADSPDADMPELLRTFSEHQRGELYEALFASDVPTDRTQWIVVSAGGELLFFAADSLEAPRMTIPIAGAVGAVRSVQLAQAENGEQALLLGAATGVYRLPLEASAPDLVLPVAEAPVVRYGFNSVVAVGGRVFGSHSELGICEWDIGDVENVRRCFESMTRDAQTVRGITLLAGDLYCAIDDRVIRWPADDRSHRPASVYTGSEGAISAVCATSDGVFAGNSAGDVLRWRPGQDSSPERLHRGSQRAAESVWLLATQGVRRLVFTDTSLHVHACVIGDSFACRYEAGGQTLRRVEVAPDLIVATNELRDRLFCWSPGKAERPRATVSVASICGHSVQDACLVPKV